MAKTGVKRIFDKRFFEKFARGKKILTNFANFFSKKNPTSPNEIAKKIRNDNSKKSKQKMDNFSRGKFSGKISLKTKKIDAVFAIFAIAIFGFFVFFAPKNFAHAAISGVDSLALSASPTSFQTFNDLQNNTTPPDLNLTVQIQINSSYVAGGKIILPLNYNPAAQNLADFDMSENFFAVKTLPNLADFPFISSIDTSNPAQITINLKSAAEFPNVAGLKSIPLTFAFNQNYNGKIPAGATLWKPTPRVEIGAESLAADQTEIKTSTTNAISAGGTKFTPLGDELANGTGIGARLTWDNYYYYQNFLDPNYDNYLYLDVPAGSILTGASDFTKTETFAEDGISYDRYTKKIDDSAASWSLWQYNGEKYIVAQQNDVNIAPPAGTQNGEKVAVRWGANYKKYNQAAKDTRSTWFYTVVAPPNWEFNFSEPNDTGDYIRAVSGIRAGDETQCWMYAGGWNTYNHSGSQKNTGASSITGVNWELKQISTGAEKINYLAVNFIAYRDASNPQNLPAWSHYKIEFDIKNALTNISRTAQNPTDFVASEADPSVKLFSISLPNLGANEFIDTIRVIPTGADGKSAGELTSRNGFSLMYWFGAWENQTWPNGEKIPNKNTPVQTQVFLNYNDNPANGGAPKTFAGQIGEVYYSSQPAAQAQLISSESAGGIQAGAKVKYNLNGINNALWTVAPWENPRIAFRVPEIMTLDLAQNFKLFNNVGAEIPSAQISARLVENSGGYNYYEFQIENYTAPEISGTTAVFSIPLEFAISPLAEPKTYPIDKILVSNLDAENFWTSYILGANQTLPTGATRGNYGFSANENYSLANTVSTSLKVLPLPELSVNSSVKSSATGGIYVKNDIVPAAHDETVQQKLTINNSGNVAFSAIKLYDILPISGDALSSTGDVVFENISGISGATVRYSTAGNSPTYGAHGSENPDLQTATFANSWATENSGADTRAIFVDLGNATLNPGESIDIVLNFKIPASGNQTAINQFRYSAVGADGSVLNQNSLPQGFSTETIALIYHENLPENSTENSAQNLPAAASDSFIAGISDKLTVASEIPTLAHFVFAGWNSAANGGGKNFAQNQIVNFENPKSIQLYAIWIPKKYQIIFEENGGNSVADETVNFGETATNPANFSRAHFKFGGWFLDENFATKYDFTDEVSEDLTLYAKWTEDEKCEFDAEIYFDDENCRPPCEYNSEIFADDENCKNPTSPNLTPPISEIPTAPNTGILL